MVTAYEVHNLSFHRPKPSSFMHKHSLKLVQLQDLQASRPTTSEGRNIYGSLRQLSPRHFRGALSVYLAGSPHSATAI